MNELEEILQHFGVKGMKWGTHKQKDQINSQARTIKKGTTIQNISSRKFENSNRHMYASYTNYDKTAYTDLMGNWMYDKSYKNEFVVKKDIKIPSDKELVNTFVAIAKKNPERVSKDMANAHNEVHKFFKKDAKYFEKKINKLDDKYTKKGEKVTKDFVTLMVSDKAAKTRSEFFGSLIKKGYNGMSDVNDREGGAQDPLIIFNPKNSLGNVKSVPLTKDDLKKYFETVNFDDKFAKQQKQLKDVQR